MKRLNTNFKSLFNEYGANIQAISLATKAPAIKFQNIKIQTLWNEFALKNNFTKIFQQLLQNLFKNGNYGIGLSWISQNKTPKIILGQIIDYEIDGFDLVKLTINLNQDLVKNRLQFATFEEWDLTKTNPYIPKKIIDKSMLDNQALRAKKAIEISSNIVNRYDFIPWMVFVNKWDEKPDLIDDLNFLFDSLNNDFQLLFYDGLISRSLIFKNNKIIKQDIKEILLNPEEMLIEIQKLQTFLADPEAGMVIKQGNPQALILLQKIQNNIALIEKLANLKINSQNFGTKNLQTAEVENMNSNFNDLLEAKANLYEHQLISFIDLWVKFCQNHELISKDFIFDWNDVDVMVSSSSKWLMKEAYKYKINQDGIKLNNANNLELKKEANTETNTNENS